jgi:cytochrome c oxidase subunit 3
MGSAHVSPRPSAAHTGVWVGVATISMSFAADTSAMVIREASSTDWVHFRLPPILYVNTLLLLASSVTLELGRRNFLRGRLRDDSPVLALPGPTSRTITWLDVTLALGLLFVAGQVVAWRQLAGEGFYLATNPSAAFFYILTVLHALHLMGGVGGLLYTRRKLGTAAASATSTLGAASLYWHFMAVLWLYLLLLLAIRL